MQESNKATNIGNHEQPRVCIDIFLTQLQIAVKSFKATKSKSNFDKDEMNQIRNYNL